MPLAPILENPEEAPEAIRQFYTKGDDGKFVLDVDVEAHPKVAGLKKAYTEDHKKVRTLSDEVKKFAEVDLERWEKVKGLEEEDLAAFSAWREEKEQPPNGNGNGAKPPLTDEEFNKRVERLTKKWEAERQALVKENGDLKATNERIATQRKTDKKRTELLNACSKAGILPGAIEDALNLGMQVFDVNDEGELFVMGKDGAEVLGADLKPLQPEEWLASKATEKAHWWPRNSGGGAGGGTSGGYGKVTRKADLKNDIEGQAQFVKKYGKDAWLNLPA